MCSFDGRSRTNIAASPWGVNQVFLVFSLIVSTLIWVKHKDNIVRLWKGTESKIGKKKQGIEE